MCYNKAVHSGRFEKKARAALTRHQIDMRKMYAEKRIIMNINIDKLHCLIDFTRSP